MSKRKKTEDEKVCIITVKGLISLSTGMLLAQEIHDALELHMRRHHAKDGAPAIVLDPDSGLLEFTTVYLDKPKKR